jgi:WXG100 family type VII secretion target
MANLNVSYDEINAAASRLSSGRDQLTDQLQQLRTFIQNLVSSGFVTDQASGAFNETYEKFTTAATATVDNLTILSQNLSKTAQVLRETDQQIAAQLRG